MTPEKLNQKREREMCNAFALSSVASLCSANVVAQQFVLGGCENVFLDLQTSFIATELFIVYILFIKPNVTIHRFALGGLYNLYSIRHPLSFRPSLRIRKNSLKKNLNEEKMEETSGRATEEGFLSQEGQTGIRCTLQHVQHIERPALF